MSAIGTCTCVGGGGRTTSLNSKPLENTNTNVIIKWPGPICFVWRSGGNFIAAHGRFPSPCQKKLGHPTHCSSRQMHSLSAAVTSLSCENGSSYLLKLQKQYMRYELYYLLAILQNSPAFTCEQETLEGGNQIVFP